MIDTLSGIEKAAERNDWSVFQTVLHTLVAVQL